MFQTIVEKIQVSLKSGNKNGNIPWRHTHIVSIARWDKFQTTRKSWHLWASVEKYSRRRQATDDNVIQHMSFEHWITKATETHRIRNTYCFSIALMVMRTRINVTFIRKLPFLYYMETYNTKASSMLEMDITVLHMFTSWSILHWTELVDVSLKCQRNTRW
jgi:hypothetical protein